MAAAGADDSRSRADARRALLPLRCHGQAQRRSRPSSRPAPLDAFCLEHRLCGALDERGPRSHCGPPSSLNTPCRGGLLGQLGEGFGVREIRRNRRDDDAGVDRHEFYSDQRYADPSVDDDAFVENAVEYIDEAWTNSNYLRGHGARSRH